MIFIFGKHRRDGLTDVRVPKMTFVSPLAADADLAPDRTGQRGHERHL
jgi:hypothetical protein